MNKIEQKENEIHELIDRFDGQWGVDDNLKERMNEYKQLIREETIEEVIEKAEYTENIEEMHGAIEDSSFYRISKEELQALKQK